MEKEIAICLRQVSKTFRLSKRPIYTLKERVFDFFRFHGSDTFQALKNINLEIYKGECVGLVGRNGSGKSTLTKIMTGIYMPDKGGKVVMHGDHLLLNLGLGFAHELTARDNVYINASILGLSQEKIKYIFDDIFEFAELQAFVDVKIKYFSSGMVQRLAFSIAMYAESDIVFLDEVFAVGDAKFVKKATDAIEKNFILNKNRTIILVSHSEEHILKYCSRAFLLHKGELVLTGSPQEVLAKYNTLQ
jgi:ABC-type polysaccharide/polyol phosphate transport system ATPase subunit